MRKPFFITGLPRSRTAWLANLFTTEESVCHHEPARGMGALLMDGWRKSRIGISDASLVLQFAELREQYPDAPWVYVDRDPQQVIKSLVEFLRFNSPGNRISDSQLDSMVRLHLHHAASVQADAVRVLTVRYEVLDDEDAIRGIWAWLLPDGPEFDLDRWQVLRGLNVQQSERRFRELTGGKI